VVDKYGEGYKARPTQKHKVHTIRFHLTISENDRTRLIEKAKQFLIHKEQIKITVQLRGRERSRPQTAITFLNNITQSLQNEGTPVNEPRPDNLNVTMNPKKRG
jgi:translation initiation factor IF-3